MEVARMILVGDAEASLTTFQTLLNRAGARGGPKQSETHQPSCPQWASQGSREPLTCRGVMPLSPWPPGSSQEADPP